MYDAVSISALPDLRLRLLDAAEQEIDANGVAASVRAIARRAGLSHQAPSYAFNNREGLLTALAERGFRILDQRLRILREAEPPGTSPRHTLAEVGVTYVMFSEERPALFQVMFRDDLVDSDDPALNESKRLAFAHLVAAVEATVADGWHPGEPIDALTHLCWSTVHGVATLDREGGLGLLPADMPLAERARQATRLLVNDTAPPARGNCRPRV